jgi:putative membrane protein
MISQKEKNLKKWTIILSFAIPIAVALLFGIKIEGYDFSFLPPIYASINGLTAILLIAAVLSIKKGNQKRHEFFIKCCMFCSVLFLGMYIAYHITSEPTSFGKDGIIKYLYYFILVTHIILSIAVIPFVLITYMRGILGKFDEHKRIARYTFPLWLYVAITGVVVYLMISPYY